MLETSIENVNDHYLSIISKIEEIENLLSEHPDCASSLKLKIIELKSFERQARLDDH